MTRLLTGITNKSKQIMTVLTEDGYQFKLYLTYQEMLQQWFFGINYINTTTQQQTTVGLDLSQTEPQATRVLTCLPNILRQWRKILPFGLACVSVDNCNPSDANDFVAFRCGFFVLNTTELQSLK